MKKTGAEDELFRHLKDNGSMDEIANILRRAQLGELKDAPNPAPADPTPGQPTPADPTPGQPAPADPAPADPAPGQPAQADPTPGQPATADPAPGQPAQADPTPGQPAPDIPGPWVKYENMPDDTKYFVIQLSLWFVMADKKVKIARRKMK
eukprot:g58114.t1